MRRLTPALLALVLGTLSAFAVACGEDREGLITSSRAAEMQELLDRIDQRTAGGRCDAVDDNLEALRREIGDLPGSVDRDLRMRLREGLENLEAQAPEECRGDERTETQPETTTTETIPPETTPPVETIPEETPPPTTPAPTTPTPTVPPATTPPEEVPPAVEPEVPSGGEEAPLGGVGDE